MSQSSRLARTIPELLQFRGQQTPKLNAFHRLNENAVWVARNWESIINDVLSLSGSLDLRGVSKGDNVIIFAPSSLEWEIMHHAVLLTGAVVIGLEPHASTEYIRAAFDTARPQHLVVQDEELLKKIPAEYTHTLSNTILLSNWSSLLQEKHPSFVPPLLSPEDPATMVFSSGSTGKPKGIIYQHQQILAACRSYENSFPSINEIRGVCWLPLANLFQRMHNLALMSSGGEIYFVDKPTTISEHLPSINPTIFIGVPRFYEKLRDGIMTRIASLPWLVREIVHYALRVAQEALPHRRSQQESSIIHLVLAKTIVPLVLSPLRKLMGRNIKALITGSAPTPMWLLKFFTPLDCRYWKPMAAAKMSCLCP